MATIYLQGVGCANPKHPNGLAEAGDASALIRFVKEWRCSVCGGGNAMPGAPFARDYPRPDDEPVCSRTFGI